MITDNTVSSVTKNRATRAGKKIDSYITKYYQWCGHAPKIVNVSSHDYDALDKTGQINAFNVRLMVKTPR